MFVADLAHPVLDDDDRHHLERVLRLTAGEEVGASDGRRSWRLCRLGPGGTLEPVADIATEVAPRPALTVAFAVTKGDRPEWTVQKLTELGVDRIVPLTTDRCVVRWDPARAARATARLRAVARQAAMQSRRVDLPEVADVRTFAEMVVAPGGGVSVGGEASAGGGAALAVPGGPAPGVGLTTVLIGPEGGWSDREEACALDRVGLGTGVLRAETAALAAGVLLTAVRAGFVGRSTPL